MEQLNKIQKVCKVFMILTKIAMIACIVGGVISLLSGACVMVWKSGGEVIGIDYEKLFMIKESVSYDEMTAICFVTAVVVFTNAILYGYAYNYLKSEIEAGTPFTEDGADQLKKLGIRNIVLPIVAIMISEVICVCLGVDAPEVVSNEIAVSLGIALILASMVCRYGAYLEKQSTEENK